ncbi:MAG: hypothetical protein H6767_04765 [Candidatus Peribacteria bacterium]|nr:MAG: hypothetical protein H6767_04765 [Candidatus Peribacteria bacterium]
MFLQAAFKDELTQYVEEKTGGAANNYGKIKTAVQMISNGVMLGILTVSDAYGMIDTLLLSI